MSLLIKKMQPFNEFVINPENRSLARNGAPIQLSAESCQALTYLIANATVWDADSICSGFIRSAKNTAR